MYLVAICWRLADETPQVETPTLPGHTRSSEDETPMFTRYNIVSISKPGCTLAIAGLDLKNDALKSLIILEVHSLVAVPFK